VSFRPFAVDTVPSMAPAHVPTATAPAGERVSFKDLATALLGETTAEPLALEAVSEPIALAPLAVGTIETPQPPVQSPALVEIVALVAATLPVEPVAPVVESPEPPALTLETAGAPPAPAPAAREREVAGPAKPAAPPLPQGFEGLKFPNDGVLTRQWMEFLSQMSASK